MAPSFISIRGAREHNLRSIDLDIPRDKLVVITGLSGSGKSSLAFDTIYAEGQRKYIESLSAYARQFLDQLQKPDIDSIEGLPPTIAIEQRSASHNPRSTVATTTEIYDYLRLLFARVGQPRCWHPMKTDDKGHVLEVCGRPIASQSATQIVDAVQAQPDGTRLLILAPLVRGKKGHHKEIFDAMVRQGFVRARVDGAMVDLRDAKALKEATKAMARYETHDIEAVVDRVVIRKAELDKDRARLADSIELALKQSGGMVIVSAEQSSTTATSGVGGEGKWTDTIYSEKYSCPLHPECSLEELEPRLFSFNSPYGACPSCHGLGTILEFDPDLIVPDAMLSLTKGAIDAWRHQGKDMNIWYAQILRKFCREFGVDAEQPFKKIPAGKRRILLYGTSPTDEAKFGEHFEGVIPNLQRRWQNTESEFVKERLQKYLSEAPCEKCHGARLKPEALNVFISASGQSPLPLGEGKGEGRSASGFMADDFHPHTTSLTKDTPSPQPSPGGRGGREALSRQVSVTFNIHQVSTLTIGKAVEFFGNLQLDKEQATIAAPILKEVRARLGFMLDVGLGYLSLNRTTGSLSGGESQRIRLATQVGSGLVGCCYVLDEPTIGLHQRDNDRLISTLRHLCDIGNSVLVVEHDEDTIKAADWVIDIGPGPGKHGGQVVAEGTLKEIENKPESLTGQYLSGLMKITVPEKRRILDHVHPVVVKGAAANNLKKIDVKFPLGGFICVTGVSGSGKSSLVNQILMRAAKRSLGIVAEKPGPHDAVEGLKKVDRVIEVDQSPIGRTPRSNPATYVGVFDLIRNLFAQTKEAKVRGYQPGRFSFNVKGGRCEACQGQGTRKIEMHFLPDVYVACESCKGTRYNRETLEVHYKGKSIADVLAMTVEESVTFFENYPQIRQLMAAINDVGLSYMQLGQPATTLSGGEAQRVKLATELGKRPTGHTLYVLDEPTTGLHFADIDKLLSVLHRLADAGNTIVVIEHNLDVIKSADWIIDLGPEGGDRGGTVVVTGTPEEVARCEGSYTGRYLRGHLQGV